MLNSNFRLISINSGIQFIEPEINETEMECLELNWTEMQQIHYHPIAAFWFSLFRQFSLLIPQFQSANLINPANSFKLNSVWIHFR